MKTTDASGTVVNSYAYDVYGNVTSSSGAQANEFQFAGQQTDPTGLQYLRARYYDPGTGTFLSRDPLSALPGWSGHPFGYVGGNPVALNDPLGLCSALKPWECIDDVIDAGSDAAASSIEAVAETVVSGWNAISVTAGDVLAGLRDAGVNWITDPVTVYGIAQAASALAALGACPASVATAGALAVACVVSVGLYGTATKLKWEEIQMRAEQGNWSDVRLLCTAAVDVPLPNLVPLARAFANHVCAQLDKIAPSSPKADEYPE